VGAKANLVRNCGQSWLGKTRAVGEKNQWERFRFWPKRTDQAANLGVTLRQLDIDPLVGHLVARKKIT
jgi:hypothetical protein